MKPSRVILIVACSIFAVFVFLMLLVAAARKTTSMASQTEVRVVQPDLGTLVEMVSAPGQIEPRTNVEISAKVAARILELPFEEGQRVTKGDPAADPPIPASVLVRLDSKDLEGNLRSVQAGRAAQAAQIEVESERLSSQRESLNGTLASLRQAQADLGRQRQLLDSKDVSQSAFDDAKLAYDELEARYASAQHDLCASEKNIKVLRCRLEEADARISQAEDALSHTVIHSPIDGIVTRLNAEVGEMVMTGTMNNKGTVIIEVADLSKMLVVAEVDEADIGKVKVGQEANVRVLAFWDDEFKGVLENVALTFDRSNNSAKYFRTEIALQGDVSKLYCGLTADVDIFTRRHENVMMVPSQAVMTCPVDDLPLDIRQDNPNVDMNKTDALVVYRYRDGKAVVTPVAIGPSDMTRVILKSGVTAEDRIIVGPYKVLQRIKHNDPVKDELEAQAERAEPSPSEASDPPAANDV